jgi:hypothetical protein
MSIFKKRFLFSLLILGMMHFISFSQINLSVNLSATDAKCNSNANGSATVTATGGAAPYTYNWLPFGGTSATASNLAAGTYKVLVTDNNGVSILDSITINQPPPLSVYIDSIIVQPCFRVTTGGGACGCGNTLWAVVDGGTAPYRYHWTPNGQVTDSIFHVCYVLFGVTVTDSNNCTASNKLNVVIPPKADESAGINSYSNLSEMKLFPVPAGNQLNVSLTEAALQSRIEIYDMLGKKVMEQKVNDGAMLITLDISSITEGNYLFRVVGSSGQKTLRFSKSDK